MTELRLLFVEQTFDRGLERLDLASLRFHSVGEVRGPLQREGLLIENGDLGLSKFVPSLTLIGIGRVAAIQDEVLGALPTIEEEDLVQRLREGLQEPPKRGCVLQILLAAFILELLERAKQRYDCGLDLQDDNLERGRRAKLVVVDAVRRARRYEIFHRRRRSTNQGIKLTKYQVFAFSPKSIGELHLHTRQHFVRNGKGSESGINQEISHNLLGELTSYGGHFAVAKEMSDALHIHRAAFGLRRAKKLDSWKQKICG